PFENKFNTELPLPSTITLGIAYQVNDRFLISVEGSRVGWSDYETLIFDFESETESFQDSENPRNYEDAFIARLGMQYVADTNLTLRLGAYYDQSPVQDEYFNPETPSLDNVGITAGFSYNFSEQVGIDLSFIYIAGLKRTSYY